MAIKNFKTNYGLETSSNTVGASVRPTLQMNFINNRTIDSRFTFTRSSNATYVDHHGFIETAVNNVPRFTYDPATKQARGLLSESSVINIFDRPVSKAVLSVTNAVLHDNQILAPDGTFSAAKLVENVTTGNKEALRAIAVAATTTYTVSVFARAGERNTFRIGLDTGIFGSSTNAYFNLQNGTAFSVSGGFFTSRVETFPNGWYRCIASFTTVNSGNMNIYLTLATNDGGTSTSYSGDGTSGMFFWGLQAEQGTQCSSFIYPTQSFSSRSSFATYQDNIDGLIKRSNVNLLTYSNAFTTSPWTRGSNMTLTANSGIAPDNTNSAWNLRMVATSSTWLDNTFSATAGVTYTGSIYVRSNSGTNNQVQLFVWTDAAVGGPATGSSVTNITATSTWTRYTVQFTPTTSGTYKLALDNNANTWAIDLMIWGAQVEEGNAATLYANTGASTSAALRYRYSPYARADMVPLLETASTNLLTKSEDLSHSDWAFKVGITATANAATSPDGTVDATALTEDTSTGNHLLQRVYEFTTGVTYTFSVFAKAPSNNRANLYLLFGAGAFAAQQNAQFNLTTGVISNVSNSVGGRATMEPIANGWYRCSLTAPATTTANSTMWIAISNGTSVSYTGTSNTLHVWGAQLEANSFPSSYIPTDTTTVTRAGDSWTGGTATRAEDNLATTDANTFLSFYNQNEGSLVVELHALANVDQQAVSVYGAQVVDPQNIRLRKSTLFGAYFVNRVFGQNYDQTQGSTAYIDNSIIKLAAAFTSGNTALAADGNIVSTGTPPLYEMTAMAIGSVSGLGAPHYNAIRSVSYYPKRLPNSELIALTEQQ